MSLKKFLYILAFIEDIKSSLLPFELRSLSNSADCPSLDTCWDCGETGGLCDWTAVG